MGRLRSRQHSEPLEGGESCRMCGARVPVGPDGRCRLGHHVRAAGAAPPAPVTAQPPPPAADTPPPPVDAHVASAPREELLAELEEDPADGQIDPGAAPQPASPPPAPPAVQPLPEDASHTVDAPARHPYDEVLAAGPPAPGPAPAPVPATDPPAAGEPRSALDDLLSWDDPMQSILDVAPDEPPAPAAAPDEPPAQDAASDPAVDPAPPEVSVADEESSVTPGEEGVAEDAPREKEQTTGRGMTVLLGSGALALLALAAFAVASML